MLPFFLAALPAMVSQESTVPPVAKPVRTPPRVLSAPEPAFSCTHVHGFYANVTISLVVNVDGKPEQVQVLKSGGAPCLDDSALKAAAKYRFAPATENGVKIPTELRININFSQY